MCKTLRKILRTEYKKLLIIFLLVSVTSESLYAYASEISKKQYETVMNKTTDKKMDMEENEDSLVIADPAARDEKELKRFSGGDGTNNKPYLISSKRDLLELGEILSTTCHTLRGYHFKLTKNINLGSTQWIPIGYMDGFSGVFDGNGHCITINKIADGNSLGLFTTVNRDSIIKNLTVKATIDKKISSKEHLNFGLIAGRSEGVIENCITEGTIKLTVNAKQDIRIGGSVGEGVGDIHNIENKASITVNKKGTANFSCGGIVGSMHGFDASLSYITNNGKITVTAEGKAFVGGIVGTYHEGKKLYSSFNNAEISLYVSKSIDRAAIGGIAGNTVYINIDRAVNNNMIYIEYTGKPENEEIIAGGIVGETRNCKIINVGNVGRVECKSGKKGIAAGIIGATSKEDSILNAYNCGDIYGYTEKNNKNEVYTHGLIGGIAEVKNFYNSGRVTQKMGNQKEINGEAFANIRPSENTQSFNYSYWHKATEPFPPLNNATATTSSFSKTSGKLTKSISIGDKKYRDVTSALNAWINSQKDKKNYVKWTGKGTPEFTESFGYN